ncbi:MAG: hypothetical protein V1818_03145 [Candidatus Aenigmatarchaeota archaeon]
MSMLDRFKRKKEEVRIAPDLPTSLPSDLEKFRLPQPEESRTDFYDKPLDMPREEFRGDKMELVLQKLDTIDTRLKLIEEKMKRY